MAFKSKFLLPVAVITLVSLQVFGVDAGRIAAQRRAADSLEASTTRTDSARASRGDSVKPQQSDSLKAASDTIYVNPADTIRIPDSLEFKDPFKFKYYIAIKDSATRAATRDTLLARGDTLELARLDSLYVKDSTEVAKAAFDKWYKSLSRKERKKYDYEQRLPILMARADSIMHRQDSIQAYKDSVRENTPRILDRKSVV